MKKHMAMATIVGGTASVVGGVVYAWLRVESDAFDGSAVEWPASTPRNNPDGSPKTLVTVKEDLRLSAKALRDAQKATAVTVAVAGAVNL